jgi:hypothetical protein
MRIRDSKISGREIESPPIMIAAVRTKTKYTGVE